MDADKTLGPAGFSKKGQGSCRFEIILGRRIHGARLSPLFDPPSSLQVIICRYLHDRMYSTECVYSTCIYVYILLHTL